MEMKIMESIGQIINGLNLNKNRDIKKPRNFVKVYDDLIDELLNIKGAELKLLLFLGHKCGYGKLRLTLDEELKEEIKKKLELSEDYLRRLLKVLKDKGFIYKDKTYLYICSRYLNKNRG